MPKVKNVSENIYIRIGTIIIKSGSLRHNKCLFHSGYHKLASSQLKDVQIEIKYSNNVVWPEDVLQSYSRSLL